MSSCLCGSKMDLVKCWDSGLGEGAHAWNLYACMRCGRILKESVWSHGGVTWLELDGSGRFTAAETGFDPRSGRP